MDKVTVRITCIARAVADCVKYRNKIGRNVALEALRDTWYEQRMTSDDLWRYAKVCRPSISKQRDQFLLRGALLFDLWFDVPHQYPTYAWRRFPWIRLS